MAFHPQIPDVVRVQSVAARHRRLPGTEKLGEGEAEAILLAKEVRADILLTDDRKARAAAVSLNVRCTGLLGLLSVGSLGSAS
jgi:predicted nucleic acid-binding protein